MCIHRKNIKYHKDMSYGFTCVDNIVSLSDFKIKLYLPNLVSKHTNQVFIVILMHNLEKMQGK